MSLQPNDDKGEDFGQLLKRLCTEPKTPPIRLSSLPPDVEIMVLGDVYLLHSTTLREYSRFFERSLSETWWKPENTHSGPDGIKYRYDLDPEDIEESMLNAVIRPVHATDTSSAIGPDVATRDKRHSAQATEFKKRMTKVCSEDHKMMLPAIAHAYQRFLRLLCHKRCDSNQLHEFREILDVVDLADLYCAVPAVSVAIENLTINWALGAIEKAPIDEPAMMRLALKIRSKLLICAPFIRLVSRIYGTSDEQLMDPSLEDSGWPWLEAPAELREYAMRESFRIAQLRTKIDRAVMRLAARYQLSTNLASILAASTPLLEGRTYQQIYDLVAPRLVPVEYQELKQDLLSIMEKYKGVFKCKDHLFENELSCARFRRDTDYPWDDSEDW